MFLKFRHKSTVLNKQYVTKLLDSGVLDQADLVALTFLTCDVDQMKSVLTVLVNLKHSSFAAKWREIITNFTRWEQKLLSALLCVGNKQALMELGLFVPDVERKVKNSGISLSPSRVVLYKIFERLNRESARRLISRLFELGAPRPDDEWEYLELYFMYWHLKGFVDFDNPCSFETVAQSLQDIDRSDVATNLLRPEVHLLHNSISDDDFILDVYPIKTPLKPGLCIIINQTQYGSEHTNRDTSVLDRDRLNELMRLMHFDVIIFENVISSVFCAKIEEAVKSSFKSTYSVFILIVMAHGDLEYIFCPDAEPEKVNKTDEVCVTRSKSLSHLTTDGLKRKQFGYVRVDRIKEILLGCEILDGLPKILILNSCRGKDLFSAMQHAALTADNVETSPFHQHVDLITCHSALPGFVSLRPEKGSIFIYVLCQVLREKPDIEICELFTLVNARLMRPTPEMSKCFEPGTQANEIKLASPFDFTSSLRKKLYLRMPDTKEENV